MKTKAKALYEFLLEYPDEYVSEEAICTVLNDHFPPSNNRLGHTTLNRDIWNAVQFINNPVNDEFPFIVLNNRRRQYKIATEKDLAIYLSHEHKLLSKKYKRLKQITQKAALNGVADLSTYESNDDLEFINTLLKTQGNDNANRTS